jgi:hypothetical protein
MKTCNKCRNQKELDRFETMKPGYIRPTCRDCYNKRRREVQGGAERDSAKREKQLRDIVDDIETCELVSSYKVLGEYRIKLKYKGFDWDIRKSSFVTGMRPWRNFRHAKFRDKKCVYRFDDENGDILYIGKSANISSRMCKHFSNYEIETLGQQWKKDVKKVYVIPFDTHADMHIAEMYLINKLAPKCNRDASEFDGTTFKLILPIFQEFWVRAVYDKIN